MSTIEERVRDLEIVNARVAGHSIDEHITIDSRLDALEERVDGLDEDIDGEALQIEDLVLHKRLDALHARLDVHRDKFRAIESVLDALEKGTGELVRDTATVTFNLKERIDRLEQNVKAELLAARERVERLEKDLGDRGMTLGADSPAYPTKPAELQQRVINATLKASAEGKSPSEAVIREVAEWLRRESYQFSARELLAQLEP